MPALAAALIGGSTACGSVSVYVDGSATAAPSQLPSTRPPTPAPLRAIVHRQAAPPREAAPPPPIPLVTSAVDPPAPIEWGAFLGTVPDHAHAAAITDLESAAGGKHMGIVMWYEQWDLPVRGNQDSCASPPAPCYGDFAYMSGPSVAEWQTVHDSGAVPMVSWMSTRVAQPADPQYQDAAIASGSMDAYIRSWADGIRDLGYPVYLRFDHEMNGAWSPYAPGQNGNTAAAFVAMWRHVYDVFRIEGASNAQWVWAPNVEFTGQTASYAALYPGDEYVDRIALDGYNDPTGGTHAWTPFHDVFATSYADIRALAPNRPLMITETGTTDANPNPNVRASGGACPAHGTTAAPPSKGGWVAEALLHTLPEDLPAARAVIYYNADNGGGEDYRVTSTACSRAAFAAAISSSYYLDGPAG